MKRALLIFLSIVLLQAGLAPLSSGSEAKTYNVLLAGGAENSMIRIWLTPDGRTYVIDSIVALEVGGDICVNPEGKSNELLCDAPSIASFEVNAAAGDDNVSVAPTVDIPVTMRGGPGDDELRGGSGPDKLIGGSGRDRLIGHRGGDALYGGPGRDTLLGGPGADLLNGGPGANHLNGGPGNNRIVDLGSKRGGTTRR
jgi:Ca2+-binding RTX toxin-like protein